MNEKDKKFWKTVIFAFVLVGAIATLDVYSMKSGVFGAPSAYENGNYTEGWWNIFKGISLFGFAFLGLAYYFLIRKDLSEALAIPIVSYTNWMFGLSDLIYFWVQGRVVPDSLPWLSNNSVIAFFGGGVVTATILYISSIIGVILSLGIAWLLKEKL